VACQDEAVEVNPAQVVLDGVEHRYAGAEAATLRGVDLTLPPGAITALLGPSGSGKSTLVAVLAGLQPLSGGRIVVDGRDLAGVPPERRGVGVVFQRPLLFPHLDARDNVAFGLRRQGVDRRSARVRAESLLDEVELAGLGRRAPHELSGGQAQRVALARALAPRPRLLLLDEPLSALDPAVRARMRDLVRGLHDSFGTTTLFITHDQTEAAELADHTALLLDGRITQAGSTAELHRRPATARVAAFLGAPALLPGRAENDTFTAAWGTCAVPSGAPSGDVLLVVAPTAVLISPTGTMPATVAETRDRGDSVRYTLRTDDGTTIGATGVPGRVPAVGEAIRFDLDTELLWTVPDRGAPAQSAS
jgi:putative spermidine/putrescine transport system ATP-binding protein